MPVALLVLLLENIWDIQLSSANPQMAFLGKKCHLRATDNRLVFSHLLKITSNISVTWIGILAKP